MDNKNLKKRPLGAFINEWSDKSNSKLEDFGFIECGNDEIEYNGDEIIKKKYNTQHSLDDSNGKNSTYIKKHNERTYHHLDFYINKKTGKLVNTDVYTTEI